VDVEEEEAYQRWLEVHFHSTERAAPWYANGTRRVGQRKKRPLNSKLLIITEEEKATRGRLNNRKVAAHRGGEAFNGSKKKKLDFRILAKGKGGKKGGENLKRGVKPRQKRLGIGLSFKPDMTSRTAGQGRTLRPILSILVGEKRKGH